MSFFELSAILVILIINLVPVYDACAVAKQRQLRGSRATAAATTAANHNSASLVVENIQPPAHVSSPSETTDEYDSLQTDVSSGLVAESQNQFAPLVDAARVHFSSSREVEIQGDESVKIRLSRGQKCAAVGTYVLWVRDGTVSVYGAILHASPEISRIFAPSTHALPCIEALSDSAEFELGSNHNSLRHLTDMTIHDGLWAYPGVKTKPGGPTFFVLGLSFNPTRPMTLDLDPWKDVLSTLSSRAVQPPDDTTSGESGMPHRVLVCGKEGRGASTFVRAALNRLLTQRNSSGERCHPSGVLLLDLDSNLPEFTVPGTIGLLRITEPVYGPGFTHVVTFDTKGDRILGLHFLGDASSSHVAPFHISAINHLLDLERAERTLDHPTCPLIIHASGWLSGVDEACAAALWAKMGLTDVVCVDSNPMSAVLRPWLSFVTTSHCLVHRVSDNARDKLILAHEHDLQMQSYFHLGSFTPSGLPCWNEMPLVGGGYNELSLSTAFDAPDIWAVAILGGASVAVEDTCRALQGALVAIVAVESGHATGFELLTDAREDCPACLESCHSFAMHRHPHLATEPFMGLSRLMGVAENPFPILAERSHCLGLGIVKKLSPLDEEVILTTPVTKQDTQRERMQGYQICLVVPRATRDRKYTRDWIDVETRLSLEASIRRRNE